MARTRRNDTLIRQAPVSAAWPAAPAAPAAPSAPATPSAGLTSAARRCRIFVSYAHEQGIKGDQPRDKSTLDDLQTCLNGILHILRDRGSDVQDDDVFCDRTRLNIEPEWSPAIDAALASCDLVIFLVSRHAADPTRFCMQRELPVAVNRGTPIIPILVEDVPNWLDLPIPGTSKKLGAYHSAGLPKKGSDAWAIQNWPEREKAQAWKSVGESLLEAIPSLLRLNVNLGQNSAQLLKADLLPFLCDHTTHDETFRDEVVDWARHPTGQALVAVVRGHYNDGPSRFAERLIAVRLYPQAKARFGWPPPEDTRRRMTWPERQARTERFEGRFLLLPLLEKLDEQLGAAAAACDTLEQLADHLHTHLESVKTPQVLMINMPERISGPSFQAGLAALLNGMALAHRPGGVLAKLWIFIVDESANAKAQPVDLAVPDATRLVWLAPMQKISRSDVEDWHKEHAVQHGANEWLRFEDCLALFDRTARQVWRQRLKRWLGQPVDLGLNDWAEAVNNHRPRPQSRPG